MEAQRLATTISPLSIGSLHPDADLQRPLRLRYAVEQRFVEKHFSYSEELAADETVQRLVTILRLVTDSNVYVPFTQFVRNEVFRPGGMGTGRRWRWTLRLPFSVGTLDDGGAKRLVSLWGGLETNPNRIRAELPLRRWAGTADRLSDEDKLIDYWVGLESLFASDSNQEVRFRAPLRIAGFLGATPDDRRQIYHDMQLSYDWRSTLVHGGNPDRIKSLTKKMDLSETAARTRGHLRTALVRLLDSDQMIDPTTVEMDLLTR